MLFSSAMLSPIPGIFSYNWPTGATVGTVTGLLAGTYDVTITDSYGCTAEVAAIVGTGAEVILPVLLVLGLFTRVSAAGLLIMTMSIQFLIPEDYGVSNDDHYLWMMLLAVPMLKGAGMFSADFLICRFGRRFCCKK